MTINTTNQAPQGNIPLFVLKTDGSSLPLATMTSANSVNLLGASLNGGPNTVGIGNNSQPDNITLGSTNTTATTTIQAGSGGINFLGAVNIPILFGSTTSTGTITIGQSTAGQPINIGCGNNTASQTIGIATGNAAAASIVNILTGAATATETLNLCTGSGTKVVNIGESATSLVVLSSSFTLSDDATANTVKINTGAAVKTTNIGSSTTSSVLTLTGPAGTLSLGTDSTLSSTTRLFLTGGQILSVKQVSSNYSLAANDQIIAVDTTSTAITITLPAFPDGGRVVQIFDASGHAAAHNITVAGNGKSISAAGTLYANAPLASNYGSMYMVFSGVMWNSRNVA